MPRANIKEQNSGVRVLHWIYAPWASIHGLSRKKTERALMSPPLHPAEVKPRKEKHSHSAIAFSVFKNS
jgi:hypothetical protein